MMRQPIRHGNSRLTPLTFEEICPIWSNRLKDDLDKDDLHILVRKPESCIVGEAWGNTSRYLGKQMFKLRHKLPSF
jgi:ATP-dependent RNA circularization protein (DNA/RNA ligase family)